MQLLNYLPVALTTLGLSLTASASPLRRADSPALTWHVSNFNTGCSPAACTYSFNIYGVATANTPGFNATCTGNSNNTALTACGGNPQVQSRIQPATYPEWNIRVEHAWTLPGDMEFYAYGETNVTSPTPKFTIPVTEEYGVA